MAMNGSPLLFIYPYVRADAKVTEALPEELECLLLTRVPVRVLNFPPRLSVQPTSSRTS